MRLLILADGRSPHARKWRRGLRSRGHEVVAASLEPSGDPEVKLIGGGRRGLPNGLRYPLARRGLRGLIDEFRPDLLNAHFAQDNGFLAGLAGFRPLVVSAWGSDVLLPAAGRSLVGLRRIMGRGRLRYLSRRVDLWTVDAGLLAGELVRLGVRADDIETVPFGVDTGLFRSPEGAEERPLSLLSIRHFRPVYDPLTVVRAAAAIKKLPDFRVEMAGDGPLRAEAGRLAGSLGLADRMGFPGLLTEVEVARKLAGAEIYVSAALSDSTSVSLLEAMACGCFPVVADIPGNREWITDGENGLLFGPGDPMDLAAKIVRAYHDQELRTRAAAINRRMVMERASLAGTLDRIEALFSKLLGGKEPDR